MDIPYGRFKTFLANQIHLKNKGIAAVNLRYRPKRLKSLENGFWLVPPTDMFLSTIFHPTTQIFSYKDTDLRLFARLLNLLDTDGE
jgi:hypothetical protein